MMKTQPAPTVAPSPSELRRRAEERCARAQPSDAPPQTKAELARLVHELQVHQIELEMQKEELQQTQAALRASEAQFRALFNGMSEGVAMHEMVYAGDKAVDYRIVDVNSAYERHTGLLVAGIRGRLATEVHGGVAPFLEIYARVARTGQPDSFETDFPALGRTFAIAVYSPQPGCFATVFADITDRHRAAEALQLSQVLYHSLVENLPLSVFRKDREGRYLFCNQRFCEILGRPPEEIVGRFDTDLFPPALAERFRQGDLSVMDSGQTLDSVEDFAHPDGRLSYLQVMKTALRDAAGGVIGVQGIFLDITERKQAEAALRASEEQFRAMFELASIGMAQADPHTGQWLRVNDKMCAITGYSPSELLGLRVEEITHPEDRQKDWDLFQRVIRGEVPDYRIEKRYVRKDGTTVWVNANMTVLRDEAGQPLRTLATIEDITERQRGEQALRESEARFTELAQQSGTIVWEVDAQGLYTYVSPTVEAVLGYRPEELVARRHFYDLHPEEGRAAFQAAAFAMFDRREEFRNHFNPAETKAGRTVWFSTNGLPLLNDDGSLRGYRGSDTDITAQRLVEASHERLVTAVEACVETIMITDANGTIVYTNPAFAKTSGYTCEEALGQNPSLLKSGRHDEAFYRQIWATLRAGQVWTGRMVNQRKDCTLFEEEASISPVFDAAGQIVNYVAVKHDITHEVELEAQFRHMQKMEAVGQLAGGVAHDFNNILTVVLMHTELAKGAAGLSTNTRESLDEIEEAGHRAVALTRQLLLFSRRQVMQTQTLDMNSAVTLFHKMLQRILGEDVRLQLNLHSQPLWVRADPGMIDQVLLNLSVNARDAMPTGGQLIIDTAEKTLNAEQARRNPEAAPGRYVWFSVRDTGEGIPPEVLLRIFEPFFTTKPVGKGTGLGLATVFGIVKQHGGWIEVFSVVGQGTTFQVYLPACARPASESVVAKATPKPQGGTETILLVEDESTVRQVTRMVLQQVGYRVLEAPDGPSALALSRQHESAIDLLLTDLVMPEGMDGRAVAEQLLLERPGLKVIFISGYSPELAARDLALLPGQQFIQKPCSPNHLLETIRDCLVN